MRFASPPLQVTVPNDTGAKDYVISFAWIGCQISTIIPIKYLYFNTGKLVILINISVLAQLVLSITGKHTQILQLLTWKKEEKHKQNKRTA